MTPWQTLQKHLAAIIAAAKAQKLCPPAWRQNWGQDVCEKLLQEQPLDAWLCLTEADVGESRTDYFKAGGMRASIGFWHPTILAGSSKAELEWEQEKQKQEQGQELEQQRSLLDSING